MRNFIENKESRIKLISKLILLNIYIYSFFLPKSVANENIIISKSKSNYSTNNKIDTHKNKKRILLLTSNGGYCHMAACNALISLLSPYFELKVVKPINDTFSFIKKDGEEFYNNLISKGWINTTNVICKYLTKGIFSLMSGKIERLFMQYFKQEKPDMVISVIPFVNKHGISIAEKSNIPYLLITLDGDLSNWTQGLKDVNYKNFFMTIAFDLPQTHQMLKDSGIKPEKVKLTGFPIRGDFFEKKNKSKINAEWKIPENKFVIMLLMGGAGSKITYKYAKKLMQIDMNLHILFCLGKNEKLAQKIKKLICKKTISFSIIPFTNKISDLMAASDLLITKSGPGSINEAIYMQLPIIVDSTETLLFWENSHKKMIESKNFGEAINKIGNLENIIKKYMNDKKYYNLVKSNMANFKKLNFDNQIKEIIWKMCPPN